jgi:putative colanic acid biosynthesis UDP-glucose lipid carrier transferase
VFMGDMSVVGPRPHMLKHTEDFANIYKQYMIRHFVKPGVTGWAQVNGFRGEITDNLFLQKRIEHDIWYMENWTLLLDIKIILMTAFLSVKGDKNAF